MMMRECFALPIDTKNFLRIMNGSKSVEYRRHPLFINENDSITYPVITTETMEVEAFLTFEGGYDTMTYDECPDKDFLPDHYSYEPLLYSWSITEILKPNEIKTGHVVQKYANSPLWRIIY